MPDWKKLVHERMNGGNAVPAPNDEVVAELAGHLEDCCEALRAEGVGEQEAVERAIGEAADWRALARKIRRAQRGPGGMNERTRQLWLPGLASLTAGNLLLMALSYASLHPRMVAERATTWFPGLALMAAYMPWVAAQPLVGALGAWLSHRAGGGRAMRLCAGLFPSIVMLACWGLFIPATAAVEGPKWVTQHPVYFVLGAVAWVAPATMGLLLGSLPFLGIRDLRSADATAARPART
ncbi:MAG TPA: hypothetical protein VN822_10800 [Candidatus Acidoferrales bacterium]|nr:hypothetical protein [Candidatus Acidoferrales bacterium]